MPDPIAVLNAALGGRYEIERQIGQGGMATVYLAEDLKHRRRVALKFLKPELAAIIGVERFLAEIDTTAQLQHPNILPLFDSGEADGSVFFVMPYVEEETLRERLGREKQLPVDEAVRIAREVAEALDYAHRKGVIHRDIKPGNILLRDGRPLVADFGIALAASRSGSANRLTETGLSLGTPFYMSPEQATGSQETGPAADIYALGCVLYEMLVGEPPYTGSTPQAVLGRIITGEARSVTDQRRSVPPNVDGAIRKAIEKLPADRFASAREFAKALEDPAFRYGELAAATGAVANRWRAAAAALGAMAIICAIFAGWALFRPQPPEAVTRFSLGSPAGVTIDDGPYGVRGLAVSPDGRTVVYADGTTGQLYRHELGELDAVPISGARDVWYPFFSPDGEWIGFIDQAENTVKKIRLDGSRLQHLATIEGAWRSAGWSSDGAIVVYSGDPEGLWRIPETGGAPAPIGDAVSGRPLRWLEMLPGGRALIASVEDTVVALSLETGEMRPLLPGRTPRFASTGHLIFWWDNDLWAIRFDPERLETAGTPTPVAQNVGIHTNNLAHFAVGGGTLVYREGDQATQNDVPVWVHRDGTVEVLDPSLSGQFRAPAISPDGRKIALEHTARPDDPTDIWIYDLDQRTFTRLTFDGSNEDPFWSPDGTEVGFSSARDGQRALYSVPADLSTEVRLLRTDPGGLLAEGSWSADGSRLVYRRQKEPGNTDTEILLSAPGSTDDAAVIVQTPRTDAHPALSPDGRWLAYASTEEGQWEVYVRPFPGPGGRTKVSARGGLHPIWARSGRELIYVEATGSEARATEPSSWVSAQIRLDPSPRVESRSEPFQYDPAYWKGIDTPAWDLSPDDQRILAIGLADTSDVAERRFVVVENFGSELTRLVPD